MSSSSKKSLLSKEQSVDFPPTPPPTPADMNGGALAAAVLPAARQPDPATAAPDPALPTKATSPTTSTPPRAAAEAEAFLLNLCVLPPRQSGGEPPSSSSSSSSPDIDNNLDALGAVPLPPLRPEEPVSSIRAALGEVVGYAHLTAYRLEIEGRPEGIEDALAAKKKKKSESGSAGAASSSSSSPSSGGGVSAAAARHSSPHEGSKQANAAGAGGGGKKSKKKKGKGGGGGSPGASSPGSSSSNRASVPPSEVVSPHTGRSAAVMIPSSVRSLEADPSAYTPLAPTAGLGSGQAGVMSSSPSPSEGAGGEVVLDDYGDLSPYVGTHLLVGPDGGAAFRVVLEKYDAAGVRDHVSRLRTLLDGNAPNVVTLTEEGEDEMDGRGREQEEGKKETKAKKAEGESKKGKGGDKVDAKDASPEDSKAQKSTKESIAGKDTDAEKKKLRQAAARKEQRTEMAKNMPSFPLEYPVSVDGTDLADFYYLACGEEEDLDAVMGRKKRPSEAEAAAADEEGVGKENTNNGSKQKKETTATKGGSGSRPSSGGGGDGGKKSDSEVGRETSRRLNDLEARCRVKCTVRFGGFHPPPPHRRVVGDLAYLEVTLPDRSEGVVHVTAVPTGFYVNRTSVASEGSSGGSPYMFDPTPADDDCYSHELLDCLLQYSKSLRAAWADALLASKERAELSSSNASNDSPLQALYRVAVRGDFGGGGGNTAATFHQQGIDSVVLRPSWLVPLPRKSGKESSAAVQRQRLLHGDMHEFNPARAEEDLTSTFGLDIRGGAARDWNEELQSARELPRETLPERLERAKMVHKVLSDFGDAALAGAKAIVNGLVAPMNPNEPTRSHVYLHNNIFFSRAVDAGVDTFKICQGDRAARKSATRDAHCMGTLHRFDILGLHTLATVLVDYLGTRLVCQSIVPGILHGDKTHTLLYGAVEATSPLSWDKDMHSMLEDSLGKGLMIATRNVPTFPLSDERMELIEKLRSVSVLTEVKDDGKAAANSSPITTICGPVEAKGIRGSDQRTYLLDLTRLTPRDANWVPKSEGGTGHWETAKSENGSSHGGKKNGFTLSAAKAKKYIPESLADEENTMAVLRPELITALTHKKMAKYLKAIKDGNDKEEDSKPVDGVSTKTQNEAQKLVAEAAAEIKEKQPSIDSPESEDSSKKLGPEDEEYLKSLRLNVNVFLPNTKSLEGIDDGAFKQVKEDEERVREAATYIWEDVLPTLTREIRENSGHNLPLDGGALTEVLHQRGINCRYLGRLATLAREEEAKDRRAEEDLRSGKSKMVPRRVMPLCWLEILECEMIARAAKHVLDSYLTENGGAAASQPAKTIASFLSALMSTGEESAAETELRVSKEAKAGVRFEDNSIALSIGGTGGNGDATPSFNRSRSEVWEDIERDIGRRFRYVLTLFNTPQTGGKTDDKDSRALYTPLLRRVCQRNGIRIAARNYKLGGKCVCNGGNATYPIAPQDIVDVLPLMKHSAALTGQGFVPTSFDSNGGAPSLYVLLPDAKATFEAAHAHWNAKSLPQALDLVQEAASLYQRVVDTPLHASVAKCLEMTAAILFHANEPELAAANAARSLAVAVQLGGFDCPDAVSGHSTLSHILLSSNGVASGIKHLRASLYLTELMAGHHYTELSTSYHKLGTMYFEIGSAINALRFYQEAQTRKTSDRLVEGMIAKSTALVLAGIGQYKGALETEKRACSVYSYTLGEDHDLTRNSANTLKQFMTLAVEQGTRMVKEDQKRKEEQAANAIATQIEADEVASEAAAKKKKSKKKKKK